MAQGRSFTVDERSALAITGLLPPAIFSWDDEAKIALLNFNRCSTDLDRYIYLMGLHDKNERLFYRILMENIDVMMPVIYTPTVGLACQNYGLVCDSPRYGLLQFTCKTVYILGSSNDVIMKLLL